MPTPPSSATDRRPTPATKRSTAAKKAGQTRAAGRAAQARKRTTTAKKVAATRAELPKTPVDRVGGYAGRAVVVPIGAALIARDALGEVVDGLRTSLSSRQEVEKELQRRRRRLEAELKRFERRGTTARTQLERDLRELRADLGKQVNGVAAQADLVTARVENALQSGLTAGQRAATMVQQRLSAVA